MQKKSTSSSSQIGESVLSKTEGSYSRQQIPNLFTILVEGEDQAKYSPDRFKELGEILKKNKLLLSLNEDGEKPKLLVSIAQDHVGGTKDLSTAEAKANAIQEQLDKLFEAVDGKKGDRGKYDATIRALKQVIKKCDGEEMDVQEVDFGRYYDGSMLFAKTGTLDERQAAFKQCLENMTPAARVFVDLADAELAQVSDGTYGPAEYALGDFLDANGKYNLSCLENMQVLGLIKGLIGSDTNVFIVPTVEGQEESKEIALKDAVACLRKGETVILPISDNSHWITVVLAPNPDNKPEIHAFGMDSMESCGMAFGVLADIQNKFGEHGLVLSSFNNFSVSGQQIGLCCGIATALNSFSLMRSIIEHGVDFSREYLNKNIFYQERDGDTFVLGVPVEMSCATFVQTIGGRFLYEYAQEESKASNKEVELDSEKQLVWELVTNPDDTKIKIILQKKQVVGDALRKLDEITKDPRGLAIVKYILKQEINARRIPEISSLSEFLGKNDLRRDFHDLFQRLEGIHPEVSWADKIAICIYQLPVIGKAFQMLVENVYETHAVLDSVRAKEKFTSGYSSFVLTREAVPDYPEK